MTDRRIKQLAEQARAGQDVNDQVRRTAVTMTPMFPTDQEPEVLVGRSVRMSMTLYRRIEALAEHRRTSVSALIRSLIEAGLDAAEQADDPETHLRRAIAETQHALQQVRQLPHAA